MDRVHRPDTQIDALHRPRLTIRAVSLRGCVLADCVRSRGGEGKEFEGVQNNLRQRLTEDNFLGVIAFVGQGLVPLAGDKPPPYTRSTAGFSARERESDAGRCISPLRMFNRSSQNVQPSVTDLRRERAAPALAPGPRGAGSVASATGLPMSECPRGWRAGRASSLFVLQRRHGGEAPATGRSCAVPPCECSPPDRSRAPPSASSCGGG